MPEDKETATQEVMPWDQPQAPEPPAKPFPCEWTGCKRTGRRGFDTPQALAMHRVRCHTGNYKPAMSKEEKREKKRLRTLKARKVHHAPRYPSDSTEYKRRKYRERVEEFRKRGLTSQGKPFKLEKERFFNKGTRKKISLAMKKRWAESKKRWAEKDTLNGAAPAPERDAVGEAAKAIIVAAQVLRAVTVGMKLP